MSTVMRSIFDDKNNQEQLFLGPGGPGRDLEFCIVRPGGLGTGPPTGVINVIDGEAGSIARADVADFCLGALFEVRDRFRVGRRAVQSQSSIHVTHSHKLSSSAVAAQLRRTERRFSI